MLRLLDVHNHLIQLEAAVACAVRTPVPQAAFSCAHGARY